MELISTIFCVEPQTKWQSWLGSVRQNTAMQFPDCFCKFTFLLDQPCTNTLYNVLYIYLLIRTLSFYHATNIINPINENYLRSYHYKLYAQCTYIRKASAGVLRIYWLKCPTEKIEVRNYFSPFLSLRNGTLGRDTELLKQLFTCLAFYSSFVVNLIYNNLYYLYYICFLHIIQNKH